MPEALRSRSSLAGIDIVVVSPPSFIEVNRAVYRELARMGWSLEIAIPDRYAYADGVRSPDDPAPDNPPLHRLRPTSDNQRLRSFRGLIALLDKARPRVVYIDSDPASVLTVQVGFWARLRGAVVICQSCDNLPRTLRASVARSGMRGVLTWATVRLLAFAAASNVAHVLSINADGLRVFSKLGFAGKVSHVPLGFDPVIFHSDHELRAETRKRLGLHHPTIAFFGMLRPTKGVHLLIEALEGLLAHDWQLLMDRFGAYRDPFTEHISNLLEQSRIRERVVFFDATHGEMPQYMNAADIVVLPSVSTLKVKEQYGRAVSEAMACGCMVIVTESGALPELVGDAGLRIPENDVPALREALTRALVDPQLRERLGSLALRRAHESLGIRQQAEIIARQCDLALGRNSPSPGTRQ